MPPFPTISGSRKRLLSIVDLLKDNGFAVDFAYYQHEDQIYARFGQHPPCDSEQIDAYFQRSFSISTSTNIPVTTKSRFFGIDDWCPDEVASFVRWYFEKYNNTRAILINYVFLSRCLEFVPANVLRIIDTHDKFADRQMQYRAFRVAPNFFYTDKINEAIALNRADICLAIQEKEFFYFKKNCNRDVKLLPLRLTQRSEITVPSKLEKIGFIGHGNDPNLFSISKFSHEWANHWAEGMPTLLIAGEICSSIGELKSLPGVQLMGYVDDLEEFYHAVDLVIAPMLMGSGLKVKVVEALSFGLPVIGTSKAFEGLPTQFNLHELQGVDDVARSVLQLQSDVADRETLACECVNLINRYNENAKKAENMFIGCFPADNFSEVQIEPIKDAVHSVTMRVGAAIVTLERSLRSAVVYDSKIGRLIATENIAINTAEKENYSQFRSRWYARPVDKEDLPAALDKNLFSGYALTLSTEWLHDRLLPHQTRCFAATAILEARADWSSTAIVLSESNTEVCILAKIPRLVLEAGRKLCAYTFDGGLHVKESFAVDVIALSRTSTLTYLSSNRRSKQSAVALIKLKFDNNQVSHVSYGNSEKLLIITDALFGVISVNQNVETEGTHHD